MRFLQGTALALLVLVPVLSGCSSGGVVAPEKTSAARTMADPVPEAVSTVDPVQAWADDALAKMTLDQKIGSLLMLHIPGTDAAVLRSGVETFGLGGLILMGDNIPGSSAELTALTAALSADPGLPLLIGIDQEGGTVSRLPQDPSPGAAQLRAGPAELTRNAFSARADMLKALGITMNFGIVADVTANPGSFLYPRVLGTNQGEASARVAAAVEGEKGKVLSTIKHFPGHGAADGDSHNSIPASGISLDDWSQSVAPAFRAGIAADTEVVMFGHLALSAVDSRPASLSKPWHDLLRDELGFQGVTITDDLLMLERSGDAAYSDRSENAIQALAAGNTMLLFVWPGGDSAAGEIAAMIAEIRVAVEQGRIPESMLDSNAHQLLVLRRTLSVETGAAPSEDSVSEPSPQKWEFLTR
jgi:beta-N-acetylhexosaminidase